MLMKKIIELTDSLLLGTEGWSSSKPRYTARAIVRNPDELYAVMYAKKFGFYSLPGGGIEEGENRIEALKREILEETGCSCDVIEELGYVYENRAHSDYTQYSYYYVVLSRSAPQAMNLTDAEEEDGTMVLWYPIEKVISMIRDFVPKTNQQKFLQARDMAALDEYKKCWNIEGAGKGNSVEKSGTPW